MALDKNSSKSLSHYIYQQSYQSHADTVHGHQSGKKMCIAPLQMEHCVQHSYLHCKLCASSKSFTLTQLQLKNLNIKLIHSKPVKRE